VTIPSRGIFNEGNARIGRPGGPQGTDQALDAGGARVWAGVINVIGLAVTFWAAFWPEPYRMAVLACLLAPRSFDFKVNDTVRIDVRSGYSDIPWYHVRP
jgi:hypothetical protein